MMREQALAPVVLAPKEGLALINGTQAHTAVAALALVDAGRLWRAAHVSGAMSVEALLGYAGGVRRPAAAGPRAGGPGGVGGTAARLLADSEIRESHRVGDPRVQDAYSLRCIPQVHGPVLDAIQFAESLVGRELNAATDNPLVFEDGTLLSGGNFHGQAVALALDLLAIVLTNLATMSERRIDRLVHPDLNQGLPPFLARDAGVHSGFMMAQVTAAALASECKVLAHPASVDTIPTDGSKEDVVPDGHGRGLEAPPRRAQRGSRAGDRADVRGTGARLPAAVAARRGRRACPPVGALAGRAARGRPGAQHGHRRARPGGGIG